MIQSLAKCQECLNVLGRSVPWFGLSRNEFDKMGERPSTCSHKQFLVLCLQRHPTLYCISSGMAHQTVAIAKACIHARLNQCVRNKWKKNLVYAKAFRSNIMQKEALGNKLQHSFLSSRHCIVGS